MSAKNRKGASTAYDHYATPKDIVRDIFESLRILPFESFLDPCCGEGNILDVAAEWGMEAAGIEIQSHLAGLARGRGHVVTIGDALTLPWPKVSRIVFNPPYTLASEFVTKAFDTVAENQGTVSALLRLGFLASSKRNGFFDAHGMPDVEVIDRPSFCMTVHCKKCGDRYTLSADAKRPKVCRNIVTHEYESDHPPIGVCHGKPTISTTDAADYGWMTWGPETTGRLSRTISFHTPTIRTKGSNVKCESSASSQESADSKRVSSMESADTLKSLPKSSKTAIADASSSDITPQSIGQ